jgi:hypothetical protein
MSWEVVATVDAESESVIREALDDAGIPARFVFVQMGFDYLRTQRRTAVDVEVEEERAGEAKALLQRLSFEAEGAVLAAEPGSSDLKSDDDRVLEQTSDRPYPYPLSPGYALVLSLFVPVLGPIYARAPLLAVASVVAHGIALIVYFSANGTRHDPHVDLGVLLLAAARFLDVVGTLQAVSRHNAAVDRTNDEESHGTRS